MDDGEVVSNAQKVCQYFERVFSFLDSNEKYNEKEFRKFWPQCKGSLQAYLDRFPNVPKYTRDYLEWFIRRADKGLIAITTDDPIPHPFLPESKVPFVGRTICGLSDDLKDQAIASIALGRDSPSDDGPAGPGQWRIKGEIVNGEMPATAWRLCTYLWQQRNWTANITSLAEPVFDDDGLKDNNDDDNYWLRILQNHAKYANNYFRKHGISCSVTVRKHGISNFPTATLTDKPPKNSSRAPKSQ